MAGIFVPHIKELLDSGKDIDIHIVIGETSDITEGHLTEVINEFVESSYPYTRKSVIHVYNYKHIEEIHKNIPWRHQIVFYKEKEVKHTKKYQLLINNLKEVEFKEDWWTDILQHKEVPVTTKGWSFNKYD